MLSDFKPEFWNHSDAGSYKHLFDFRRLWKQSVLITSIVALVPLITLSIIDYNMTQQATESEILLRTARIVSNTRRTLSFFLTERRFALNFIIHDNTYEQLNDHKRLGNILENLRKGLGGFSDMGIIDDAGYQKTYVGQYQFEGVNYKEQAWFKKVAAQGVYISDVFLGLRNIPHLIIAIRQDLPNGSFYVLRATLEIDRFNELISELEVDGDGDALVINHEGILQLPSRHHGKVLEKISLPIPEHSDKTQVREITDDKGKTLVVGYAYIAETPFILMVVKDKTRLMYSWFNTRVELISFLFVSIVIILIVTLSMTTYLVDRIYIADQRRVMTLHQVEYENKMASVGRLAAGVAHEINNPLAIINEKAGLVKDLFTFKGEYKEDPRLLKLIDMIISSVERCANITRRLLSFARHKDAVFRPVCLREIIQEVIGFLGKEAEHRDIHISTDIPDDIPQFDSDKGKLQQIFINLMNNAFAAMDDSGSLDISARRKDDKAIVVTVKDSGCGIPEEDIERVFEPFFTTKLHKGGTGLGLSITYGLVKELSGTIFVTSELGKGTTFIITLPISSVQKNEKLS
jgi:signal transduction histidine kinase